MSSSQLRRGIRSAIALSTCITLTSTACGPGLGGAEDPRELVPRKGGSGQPGGGEPPGPDDLPVPENPVVPIEGVSRLEGGGRVSPSGAYQYSIPLWTPRGRAGMEPSLTLAYSSQRGNGLVGVGWSLSAGSAISRCNQVMARDSVVDNPQFDNDDNFCLGGQKLVEVPPPPEGPAGAYPGIANVFAEYRTERESFSRVLAIGSSQPESWMVFRPSGQIEYYGVTGDGRVEGYRADGSLTPVTLAWQLEEATDRNANEIRYEWEADPSASASRRLARIRYTVSAGGPYVSADERRVDFVYEDRPDPLESWVNGLALRTTQRLSRVDMWAPVDGAAQRVRHYELTYDDSKRTFRSLLTSARMCDATDACTKPTVFEYAQPTGQQAVEYQRTPGTEIGGINPLWFTDLQVFDFDGDGYDDILYDTIDGGVGVVHPPYSDPYEEWFDRAHPRARLSDGSYGNPFTTPIDLGDLFPHGEWSPDTGVRYARHVGKTTASRFDADGDGRLEWAAMVTDHGERLLRRYSLDPQTLTVSEVPGSELPCGQDACSWQPLDFDGDGDPDLARHTYETDEENVILNSVLAVFENDGAGNLTMGSFIQGFGPEIKGSIAMDHEGNGTADLLTLDLQQRFGVFGQREGTAYNIVPGGESLRGGTLADVNGDGLRDIVWPFGRPPPEQDTQVPTSAGPEISINTGMGYLPPTVSPSLPWPPAHGGWDFPDAAAETGFDTRVADFNGDGRDDILILRHSVPASDVPDPIYFDVIETWLADLDEPLMLMLSTGDGFELNPLDDPRHVLFHPYAKYGATKLGDIDGDGRPEILSVSHPSTGHDPAVYPAFCYPDVEPSLRKHWSCYEGFYVEIGTQDIEPLLPSAFDRLIEVEDGYGATETVHYGRGATDPEDPDPLHTPADDCARPERCLIKTGDLVATHTVGQRSWQYRYHGGRANVTGRGALGFEKVVITDQVDMSEVELEYDLSGELTLAVGQVYPYAGMPEIVTRTIEDDGRVYETQTHNHYHVEYLTNRYYVVLEESFETVREDGEEYATTETLVEHDEYGNPVHVVVKVDDRVQITERTFDNDETTWLLGRLRREEVTDMTPLGTRTRVYEHDYDINGLLQVSRREPDAPIDPALYLEVEILRDAGGVLTGTEVRDDLGNVRTSGAQYDDDGVHLVMVTDAIGQSAVTKYDHRVDAPVTTSDINGAITFHTYDGLGRPRSTIHPTGLVEETAYDDSLSTVTVRSWDNAGHDESQGFDAYLRLMVEQWSGFDQTPVLVHYTRDEVGRALSQTLPRFQGAPIHTIAFEYDNLGRPERTVYADNTEETWRYPQLGTVEHFDPVGNYTKAVRRPDGLESVLERSAGGQPQVTTTTMGPFGLPVRLEGPSASTSVLQPAVVMEYDVLGRRTLLDDPNLGELHDVYNAFGELEEQTAANGVTRTFDYDDLGRIEQRNTEDGVDHFEYGTATGERGRLVMAGSADGVDWTSTYDALGRPETTSYAFNGEAWTIEQTYDGVGRPLDTWYPVMADGTRARVRQVYGNDGYLTEIREETTGITLYEVELRDAASRITQSNRAGLIDVTNVFSATTGRIEQAHARSVLADADLMNVEYQYYDDGRLWNRTDLHDDIGDSFLYDGLGRLTQWDSVRQGNLQSRVFTFDGDGRLDYVTDVTASGTPTVTEYDYPGAGAARPHAASQIGNVQYFYDAMGREKKAQDPGGPVRSTKYNSQNLPTIVGTQGGVAKFQYDPFGSRFRKETPSGERVFVGGLYERSLSASGEAHRMNVAGPEGLVAVLEWTPDDPIHFTPTYVLQDERGAAAVTTDHKGNEKERLYYDPSGARLDAQGNLANAGASMEPLPGYSGHLYDDDLGLIDMKGRIFDPRARKFLTPDPVLDNYAAGRGLDRYGLVGFDPINKVDPTGFQASGGCDADVCFPDDHITAPGDPIPPPGDDPQDSSTPPPAGGGYDFIYGDYDADLFFYAIPVLNGPYRVPLGTANQIFTTYPFLTDVYNRVEDPNARDRDLLIMEAIGVAAELFGVEGVAIAADLIVGAADAGNGENKDMAAHAAAPRAGLPANAVRMSRRVEKIRRTGRLGKTLRGPSRVRFKRWKRGEPIDKPLADGTLPDWKTVRSRYWKNRYEQARHTDEFTQDPIMGERNLARMRRGRAPLKYNHRTRKWEPAELHHVWPQRLDVNDGPGNLWEVTPDQHARIDLRRKRSGL